MKHFALLHALLVVNFVIGSFAAKLVPGGRGDVMGLDESGSWAGSMGDEDDNEYFQRLFNENDNDTAKDSDADSIRRLGGSYSPSFCVRKRSITYFQYLISDLL